MTQVRGLKPHQRNRRLRAARQALAASLERSHSLTAGVAEFVAASTPTVGDLVDYMQQIPGSYSSTSCWENSVVPNPISFACINTAACAAIHQEYVVTGANGIYGQISCEKPDNNIRLMYKNLSSLCIFAKGVLHHKKIRHLNKLAADYGVDVIARCETRTNWRFVTNEEDKFCNLYGNGTRRFCSSNTSDGKIKQDQWGGTCITAVGSFLSFVTAVGSNASGLGRWSWIYTSGGGKSTRIVVAYQPCNPRRRGTRDKTIWDQHLQYFEARGK